MTLLAIRKFSKILMPVLILFIIGIVIYAMRMDGWREARNFMFDTEFSQLRSPRLWFFALGQAFYTLAVGQGYLITYGSYIPCRTHVPPVFGEMNHGAWLAMAFLFLFFAAAFSSCLAGLKVVIAAFSEELWMGDLRAVMAVGCLMLFLGIPSALSSSPVQFTVMDMRFLDFMDQVGGTNVIVASGVIGAGLFCWFIPRQKIAYSLGAKRRWWEFRIFIVGRSLPFLALLFFIWYLLF